jgi:macrolide-specific efflux system membrane fusion protein
MRVWWFATAGLVLIGLAAVAYAVFSPTLAGSEEVEYLTSAVATADVTDEVVATGTLQAARTYTLSFGSVAAVSNATPASTDAAAATDGSTNAPSGETSTVTWEVTAVNVGVGDHVAKGDVLATSDTSDIKSDIAVARAQVDAAEEQVDAADGDQASATAEAALLEAERTLAQLRAARGHTRLVAPADGTITTLNIEKGANAPDGAAIVVTSDALVATGTVSEADVSSITTGQEATVSLSALDEDVSGLVTEVALSGSSTSGVVGFGILIRLDEVPDGARAGMSADISVVAAEALDVLAVPSAAIDGSAGSYTVTVLAADGSTDTRAVEVGLVTDDLAEITDGLSAGETVVTGTASDQQTTNNGGFGGPGGNFGGGPGGGFAPPGGD